MRSRSGGTRDLEGLLVVDKPPGITSHDVVDRIRQVAGIRRVGHAGTLDPVATGVLALLLGATTRLLRFLSSDPKIYEVTVRFGWETSTGDRDGAVTRTVPPPELDDRALSARLPALLGEIDQTPPMYSAKRVAGRRLYQAARAGLEVDRPPQRVRVDAIRLLWRRDADARFEVVCSPGTYVRCLVEDLGRLVGSAAHVLELRRMRSGRLDVAVAAPLDKLACPDDVRRHLVPLDQVPLDVPELVLEAGDEAAFRAGRATPVPRAPGSFPALVSVRSPGGARLGIGALEMDLEPTGAGSLRLHPRVVLSRSTTQAGAAVHGPGS